MNPANEVAAPVDFVLGNPPFNVNAPDIAMHASTRRDRASSPQDLPERQDNERLRDMVWPNRRFPFGMPRTDNAAATRASAENNLVKPDRRSVGETELHYLWIHLFRSALNENGSAGFVTANPASEDGGWLTLHHTTGCISSPCCGWKMIPLAQRAV